VVQVWSAVKHFTCVVQVWSAVKHFTCVVQVWSAVKRSLSRSGQGALYLCGPGMACCKCGKQCSGYIEAGQFFGQLSDREVEERAAP